MKTTIKSLMFAALAVSFAASCAKEVNPESVQKGNELHFIVKTAPSVPVKSYLDNNLDGTYTPKWEKGDGIAIFTESIIENSKVNAKLYNTADTGLEATFDGTVTAADKGELKAISPEERVVKGLKPSGNTEFVGVELGDAENAYAQNPTFETIDPKCDILVSKPTGYESDGETVVLNAVFFKRVMSVVKINVVAPESFANVKIKNFSMTSSSETLGGRAKIDVTNVKVSDWTIANKSVKAVYSAEDDMPVLYDGTGVSNTVYLVVNPVTLSSGTTLTFSGETADYQFSKEIALQSDITFPEGQIAVINLSLADSNFTSKSVTPTYALHASELVEGEYLIVYDGRAMKAAVSSDRLSYSDVTVTDNKIQTSDGAIVWHISKSGDYWTIYNESTKTFAAGTGKKSKAQLLSDDSDDKSLWTATKTKDAPTFEFVNKANKANTVNANLRGNGTYGFACYSTSTGGALSLYKYSLEAPMITLEGAVATITCATEGVKIYYTVGDSPADPTSSDTEYTSPVTLTDGQTIKAIAIKSGKMFSDVASKKYSTVVEKKSGSVKFGSAKGSVNVNSQTVTGSDAAETTWTVTTVGTTSFTANAEYSQIGSSSKPASSITIVGKISSASIVQSVSVKFGGFSSTEGTISVKVGETEVGNGSLVGNKEVTVSSTASANGDTITITVTGIKKGVKLYGVDYTYSE